MRCTTCGGNANHCKCPMPYVKPRPMTFEVEPAAATAEQTHTPHHPQAVTAEPERPPFAPNDTAEILDNPGTFITVADCEKTVCHGIIPWIVTDTDGKRHYAKGLRRVEGKEKSPPVSPTFICPACGGKHFGRDPDTGVVDCHDQFEVMCHWRGVFPGVAYDRLMANRKALIVKQVDELQARILQLTSDRDGARRALAGNIEVTERQLKEAGAEIEELRAVLLSIDVKVAANPMAWIFEQPSAKQWQAWKLRRDAALKIIPSTKDQFDFGSVPSVFDPNPVAILQPGTEADHGTRPIA